MPGMGGIWLCGVDAGVGGFRSPPSAIELLVDWGVCGPCIEPEPAKCKDDAMLGDSIFHGNKKNLHMSNDKCQMPLPGDGGWIFACFFASAEENISGGGSSPLSILHSKAYRHCIYCFFRELAALLDVPTFKFVASSLHFLFLLTWEENKAVRDASQWKFQDEHGIKRKYA